MAERKVRITIRVSPAGRARLNKRADEEGTDVSDLVRRLLAYGINTMPPKKRP